MKTALLVILYACLAAALASALTGCYLHTSATLPDGTTLKRTAIGNATGIGYIKHGDFEMRGYANDQTAAAAAVTDAAVRAAVGR